MDITTIDRYVRIREEDIAPSEDMCLNYSRYDGVPCDANFGT